MERSDTAEQWNLDTGVLGTEADALDALPRLVDAMDGFLRGKSLRCVGYPDLPRSGVSLAEVRGGYRCIVAYSPFFYVGHDDDGEPIYQEGWRARVDAFTEPIGVGV